ncbi:MAG: aldehyde dehydrogenase family protein [Sphingomonadales bacterium]
MYEEFATALTNRVEAMRVGPEVPIGEADCGPLIDAKAVEKVSAHVSDCVARGGQLLVGGNAIKTAPGFFEPTVISEVPANALLCREETFGPVAGLVRFDDEDEAIALANCSRAGLASYFFTRDYGRVHRVSEALDYGMVGVNTGIISTEVAPFGGVKESGLGREGSRHGIGDYLEIKMGCAAI